MELRIKRLKPGQFSLHTLTGEAVTNARHLETRYERGKAVTTVEITHDKKLIGRFERVKSEGKRPLEGSKKQEVAGGSESNPA